VFCENRFNSLSKIDVENSGDVKLGQLMIGQFDAGRLVIVVHKCVYVTV